MLVSGRVYRFYPLMWRKCRVGKPVWMVQTCKLCPKFDIDLSAFIDAILLDPILLYVFTCIYYASFNLLVLSNLKRVEVITNYPKESLSQVLSRGCSRGKSSIQQQLQLALRNTEVYHATPCQNQASDSSNALNLRKKIASFKPPYHHPSRNNLVFFRILSCLCLIFFYPSDSKVAPINDDHFTVLFHLNGVEREINTAKPSGFLLWKFWLVCWSKTTCSKAKLLDISFISKICNRAYPPEIDLSPKKGPF